MPLSGAATSLAFTSRVVLSSDKAFNLGSGSSGNSNFGTLGFTAGTFGGNINGLTVQAMDVTTTTGAQNAISTLDSAIKQISFQQARSGAFQNRLDSAIQSLSIKYENMSASESRIRDVDVAKEAASLTKNQILQQASATLLAQANQSPQVALSLL
jgi:flagellin